MEMDLAIGIDLGTTFCCLGVYREGKGVEIIPNKLNETTFPSIVTFNDNGILACDQAVNHLIKNSKNTIFGIKRIIGLNYEDKRVQEDISLWPFDVIKSNENDSPMIKITNKNNEIQTYYPEEISAIILRRLKSIAEDYLERTIKFAVITVPAYFNNSQREATKKAGELAGFTVLRIINEPTAAALGYGLDKKYGKLSKTNTLNNFLKLEEKKDDCDTINENEDIEDKHILVFDLGGGTFDVSLVRVTQNEKFEVKSTSGDTHLGGEDFDNILVEKCLQEFCCKYSFTEEEVRNDTKGMKRLKLACEKTKKQLSFSETIQISVDNLYNNESFYYTITREQFEEFCSDLFLKLTAPIEEVINQAKIDISSIKEVVMVGGSTRIPKIKDVITSKFKGVNIKINDSINPDEAVAYGAAVDAYKIHSKKKAILNDIILLDTIPFSLGLGIGEQYQLIIPKGSTIPTEVKNLGMIDRDYHNYIELPIYEGEYNDIKRNHFLGKFKISDIPMKKAGEVLFDVIYKVDVDGILTVRASMKDDPSKSNLKVIKNDNIGLTTEELIKRNAINNYDPNQDIEEFKKNDDNLKRRMIKLKELYENAVKFDQKMKYLKNFCKIMAQFIDTFDSYQIDNDTVMEKYYLYLQGLFESYNIYFSKLNKEDKEFQDEVINKIINYFSKISVLDTYYIKNLIDKLKQINSEIFQEIVVNVIRIMTQKGRDILSSQEKWSKYKSKIIFNEIIKISSDYIKEDELNLLEDVNLYNNWETNINICKESIKKINASTKAKIEGNRDSLILYIKKEDEDEEHIELVLDNYREALQELENNNQKFDLELEAIILANIAKIKYKYLQHDNKINFLEDVQRISAESVRRAIQLVNIIHKNVENTNWFKEIKEIDIEIQNILLSEEEKNSGGFQSLIKLEHKEIFEELDEKKKKSNLEIIKFILSKYPPLNFVENQNKTMINNGKKIKKI